MKYASPYYGSLKLARSNSNLNKLCWELERWQKKIRFKRTDKTFDSSIMIDPSITVDSEVYNASERLYKAFNSDVKALQDKRQRLDEDARKKAYAALYDKYRAEMMSVCSGDVRLAANVAVMLSDAHKSWNQKFKWIVAGSGIVKNIKQTDVVMPIRKKDGEFDYLGKKYNLVKVFKEDLSFD